MSFIEEIRRDVRTLGANEVANRLKLELEEGKLDYRSMPTWKQLYETFVTEKNNDKVSTGAQLLNEGQLNEEAASVNSLGAFNVLGSQLYLNAFTSKYEADSFTIKPLFGKVNTSFLRGEKIAGLTNINAVLQPTPFNAPIPALLLSQDYVQTPPLRQFTAELPIGYDLMAGDCSGQITESMEKLGEAGGTGEEIEAVACLSDLNSNRTRYNWLPLGSGTNSVYATYQSSTPWINVTTSNPLVGLQSLNTTYVVMANIVDPFTNLPIVTARSPWKLIVTPSNYFTARRIVRQTQYRYIDTEGSNYENSIADGMAGFPVEEIEVVVSKYLSYYLGNNGGAQTTWYMGTPSEAIKWFVNLSMTMSEAVTNAGELWSRNLAASFKFTRVSTPMTVQPRFLTQNTA